MSEVITYDDLMGAEGFDEEAMDKARAQLYRLFVDSPERGNVCRVFGFEDGARWHYLHSQASHFSQLSEKEQRIQELGKALGKALVVMEAFSKHFLTMPKPMFNRLRKEMNANEDVLTDVKVALSPLGEPKETPKDDV